jgi:hypothetical protein
MSVSTLRLAPSTGGWQLLEDGQPLFWFPDRAKGLEIAMLMADARSLNHGTIATVETQNDDGRYERVAEYG